MNIHFFGIYVTICKEVYLWAAKNLESKIRAGSKSTIKGVAMIYRKV